MKLTNTLKGMRYDVINKDKRIKKIQTYRQEDKHKARSTRIDTQKGDKHSY